jgi:phage recombination protein Bet
MNDLIEFDTKKLDLIKRTVAKGATDDELALFLHACKRTGLDPFMKQIHAIKRYSAAEGRETMAIQTGIDGYRLVAERTGKYAGSDEPLFEENGSGHPVKATVTVWKIVEGQRFPFTASARWDEYVQKKKDGAVTSFWQRMPYGQLGKCAESLALRKAFPAELSGVYTHEEMMQADDEQRPPQKPIILNIPQVRKQTGIDEGQNEIPIHPSVLAEKAIEEQSKTPPFQSAYERGKEIAAAHNEDVPKIGFGKHKGKAVNDSSIPADYLSWLEPLLVEQIDDPKLSRYRTEKQNLLAAVREELINRGMFTYEEEVGGVAQEDFQAD